MRTHSTDGCFGFVFASGAFGGRPRPQCSTVRMVVQAEPTLERGLPLKQMLVDFERGVASDSSRGPQLGSASDLSMLVASIALGCKRVLQLLRAGQTLVDKELFVQTRANSALKSSVWSGQQVSAVSTSDDLQVLMVGPDHLRDYVCVFDTLSSFEEFRGYGAGTIFGIFERNQSAVSSDMRTRINQEDITCLQMALQSGSNLLAAGYCLYSSSTVLVLCIDGRVHEFVLDEEIGEFVLTKPNIRVPTSGPIYSVDSRLEKSWEYPVQYYFRSLLDKRSRCGMTSEFSWNGSLVADAHRVLKQGGILGIPGDRFDYPNGRLYLLYQCAPLSLIFNAAGGRASTGRLPVARVLPTKLSQKSPLFLGSAGDVDDLDEFIRASTDPLR